MRTIPSLILAVALAACASAPPRPDASAGAVESTPIVRRPLEGLAVQHIIVLPAQYLSFGDSLGWRDSVPRRAELLARLDDEIAFALGQRGLEGRWTFAGDIAKAARANSTFIADPHALSAEYLRGQFDATDFLREPLGSQIRGIASLRDGRYVLLPVELRFESAGGMGVAVLRILLIDAKLAGVKWAGEVRSEPAPRFSTAVVAGLASRLADLVAP